MKIYLGEQIEWASPMVILSAKEKRQLNKNIITTEAENKDIQKYWKNSCFLKISSQEACLAKSSNNKDSFHYFQIQQK